MSNYTSFEALKYDFDDKLNDLNQRYWDGTINAVDRAIAVGELNKWFETEADKIEEILAPEED